MFDNDKIISIIITNIAVCFSSIILVIKIYQEINFSSKKLKKMMAVSFCQIVTISKCTTGAVDVRISVSKFWHKWNKSEIMSSINLVPRLLILPRGSSAWEQGWSSIKF
jgi:hypothetical protein